MNSTNDNERAEPPETGDAEGADAVAGRLASQGAARGVTDVQAYIGRQLRAVYDDVVKQPIPDRFLALMKQLEEQAHKG